MGKIKYLVIALFFVAAGTAAFYFVFDTQEFIIKRQFGFIAEKIQKSSGESPVISIEKVNSLTKAIAEPCLIHIPAYSYSRLTDSKDLSGYVLEMRSWYSKISLIFSMFFLLIISSILNIPSLHGTHLSQFPFKRKLLHFFINVQESVFS